MTKSRFRLSLLASVSHRALELAREKTVRWRIIGDQHWKILTYSGPNFTIPGLKPGTRIEYQVA